MIRVLEPNKDYIIRADRNGIVDDVIEYKHGYWVQGKESSRCSECNCTLVGQALWTYCPNCGAKMDDSPAVDSVEVVRCKDCRWGTAVEHEFVQGADIRCQQHNCFTNHDSFCSLREKKDGNT